MYISGLGCVGVMLCMFIQTASSGLVSTTPRISGHVLYEDGAPVTGADIEIHFYGPTSGILPEGRTDKDGYFSIAVPPYGDGVVSASKVSEGYPNAALAFYGRTGYKSIKRINVTPTTVIDTLELRFGEPDATINLIIQSAETHEIIPNARIHIALYDQPEIDGSYPASRDGKFNFVLPKSPVSIKVTAPGYAEWSYSQQVDSSHALLLKPGTRQQLAVFLNKLK